MGNDANHHNNDCIFQVYILCQSFKNMAHKIVAAQGCIIINPRRACVFVAEGFLIALLNFSGTFGLVIASQ